jgi:hypothetical protein
MSKLRRDGFVDEHQHRSGQRVVNEITFVRVVFHAPNSEFAHQHPPEKDIKLDC